MKRLQSAIAIFRFASLSVATLASGTLVYAADKSFSTTVTNAFETVVIDAKKVADKATTAAKEALASEPGKSNRTKKSKKDADAKNDAKADDSKTNDSKADAAAAKKAAKASEKTTDNKQSATKSEASKSGVAKEAAEKPDGKDAPSAKAADGAKPPKQPDTKSDAQPDAQSATGKAAETPKKPAIPTEWPAVDVELARARCTQLLKGVDAVTVPEAPFRKGDCGTMAPVRLISVGKNPEVSLSPPAVVTCDMVVALTKWVKEDVQPSARRHLGSEVIQMESMSDYSCRMAYGRVGNKLSEHGKANALDIRGFTTRKGNQAIVLTGWGQTKRDVEKQIAAAKAATAKAEAVKLAAEKANAERAETAAATAQSANTGKALPRKTLVEGLPPPAKTYDPSLALPTAVEKEGFGIAPTRLGGPKEAVVTKVEIRKTDDGKKKTSRKDASKKGKTNSSDDTTAALPPGTGDEPAVAPAPQNATSRFLHETHAAACTIFGTTLGPEANEAHRNHFHVDMAERKVRKICD